MSNRPTSALYEEIPEIDDQYTPLQRHESNQIDDQYTPFQRPESNNEDDGEYLQPMTTNLSGATRDNTMSQDGVSFSSIILYFVLRRNILKHILHLDVIYK